jgi:hypothetical protein
MFTNCRGRINHESHSHTSSGGPGCVAPVRSSEKLPGIRYIAAISVCDMPDGLNWARAVLCGGVATTRVPTAIVTGRA